MSSTMSVTDGAVHSSVRLWLRLEGLTALLVATYLDAQGGGSWASHSRSVLRAGCEFCPAFRRATRWRSALQRGAQLRRPADPGGDAAQRRSWADTRAGVGSAHRIRPRMGLRAQVSQCVW